VEHARDVEMSLPGTLDAVRRAADGFDAFAAHHGLPEDVVQSVQVALDELVSNAVRHGYAGVESPGSIDVRFGIRADDLLVEVSDAAPAFNPLEAPEPDTSLPIDQRPIGGLGLLLVRRLMDRVEYERRDGRNRLSLWKNIEDTGTGD